LLQTVEFAHALTVKISVEGLLQQISLLFSLLAGNLSAETGSNATASATIKFNDLMKKNKIEQKP